MIRTVYPHQQPALRRGHIGLVVLGSIAAGLLLGLALVLVVFAGGPSRDHRAAPRSPSAPDSPLSQLRPPASPSSRRPGRSAGYRDHASSGSPSGRSIRASGSLGLAGWVWPRAACCSSSPRSAARGGRCTTGRAVRFSIRRSSFCSWSPPVVRSRPSPRRRRPTRSRDRSHLSRQRPSPLFELRRPGSRLSCSSTAWASGRRAGPGCSAPSRTTTRVCAFDRAGEGWSGPAARPGRTSARLRPARASAAAHVPGPYVLAGHSVGGTYALVYAKHVPDQVAGVALIDSSTPYQFDLPEYPGELLDDEARLCAHADSRTHGQWGS